MSRRGRHIENNMKNSTGGRRMKHVMRNKAAATEFHYCHDEDDAEHVVPITEERTLVTYLNELEQKKALDRENALRSITEILNNRDEYLTLQNNFATCLYRILDLVKRGCAKEKELASHALGLMGMTLGDTDNAQEIYRESVPVLTKALSKTSKMLDPWTFISLVDSLAIITFFCASNIKETEAAMQTIWGFILPKSKFDVCASKQNPTVLSAAISAWSFLLTAVDAWDLSHKNWQGGISHFLDMLEADDESVCVVAGEALAQIFNCEMLEKFFGEAEDPSSAIEITKSPLAYTEKKNLIKYNILKKLETLSIKIKNTTSLKQTFSNASRADWDVLKYFTDDKFPQSSVRINGQKLTILSWSQMIQMKFLKNFLREEQFVKHMLRNELLQHLFEFTPTNEEHSAPVLYESTMEKMGSLVILPQEVDSDLLTRKEKKQQKLLRMSIIDKEKTKMLSKIRMFAQERKGRMYHIEEEQ